MADPQTPDEWQAAVETADFLLLLDSAIQYGLVVGGPTIDADRCLDLLHRGASRGIYPAEPIARRRAIARWLRCERADLGLTQRDLGRQCGVSQAWIARIESGQWPTRDEALGKLRAAIEQIRKEQGT
jgi:DNA-binding XRE family transcriptional regulator